MKKVIYIALATIQFFILTCNASAQVNIKLTCATWISERGQSAERQLQIENWLNGYLAGLTDGSGENVATVIDQPSSPLWMDNYCRGNPNDGATEAGAFLINELLKKKHAYRHQY